MLRKSALAIALLISTTAFAADKHSFKWFTTHSVEKFPCMNEKESQFLKRIVDMQKIEQKKTLLADHRKNVKPTPRHPASIHPEVVTNQRFICPPFKGVRNPYPQAVEFGKAAPFERFVITENTMNIINGLSKNEKWNMSYNSQKGYYEGETPRGTPTNLIPLSTDPKGSVRFFVQYLIWKDKTPPSLTLCYREDLHAQCNPYKDPALKAATQQAAGDRAPASVVAKPQKH